MVEDKYFKSPLGEDEKDKKKRVREEEKRRKVWRMNGVPIPKEYDWSIFSSFS